MLEHLKQSSSNFNAVRDGRTSPDFYFDLDLSVVFDQQINVAGNSFYCDANPNDGVFDVYFQDTDGLRGPTPFYASPGFIAKIPFTQIRVVNRTAQPGKKARVVYGTDVEFQPGSVSQVSFAGDVTIQPQLPTAFINAGNAGLPANTAIQLLAPAANPNGLIILQSTGVLLNPSLSLAGGIIAKTTPPTSIFDGDPILFFDIFTVGAQLNSGGQLSFPQRVGAGMGLYIIADNGPATYRVAIRYRVL